jgi:hypothetical protein
MSKIDKWEWIAQITKSNLCNTKTIKMNKKQHVRPRKCLLEKRYAFCLRLS